MNPYSHELNTNGTACATNCPACRWAADMHDIQHIFDDILDPDAMRPGSEPDDERARR